MGSGVPAIGAHVGHAFRDFTFAGKEDWFRMSERFGRYTLLKRLGAGGMGEVFLAQPVGSEGTDHFVVVKTLLPQLAEDEKLVRMFLEEANLASRLDHQNICRVLDLGLADGILFMALEYIRGADLDAIGRKLSALGRRISISAAVRIVAGAARGLDHAHQLADPNGALVGLVHRDVSPHNLLVTYDGKVKVIDFGLAKTVGIAQHSHTGSLKGKFAYMSPEMVRDEHIDLRIDVFALGVVLHELLSGERLFAKDTDVQTLAAVIRCDVPPLAPLNPDVPPELDAIVQQALAKDRPRRFQSAGAFADALDAFLASPAAGAPVDLGAWMRELYRSELQTQATRGLLHDAPDGPLMMTRALVADRGAATRVLKETAEPSHRPNDAPPSEVAGAENSRPAPSDAPTEEAHLDSDGIPVVGKGVRLAPRPSAVQPTATLGRPAPPARRSLSSVPERSLAEFAPPEQAPAKPAERTRSAFEILRQQALRHEAQRLASTPSCPAQEPASRNSRPAFRRVEEGMTPLPPLRLPTRPPAGFSHAETTPALGPPPADEPVIAATRAQTNTRWIVGGLALGLVVVVAAALVLALA